MANRPYYKIPYDLAKSSMDMEIALKSSSGVGLKPLPLRVIVVYLISVPLLWWFIDGTPIIKDGTLVVKILFIFFYFIMVHLLARYDDTKEMGYTLIKNFVRYIPKTSRHIKTKSKDRAFNLLSIYNIKEIRKDGFITYTDGACGRMYSVVGSASALLFEDDRQAILDRVDNFYRNIICECELIQITAKEAQRIDHQLVHIKRRYENLQTDNQDLLDLLQDQVDVLRDEVGGEYKSIHQYFLLRADNKEVYRTLENFINSEVENSSYMIKRCTELGREDIYDVLRSIYRNDEQDKALSKRLNKGGV